MNYSVISPHMHKLIFFICSIEINMSKACFYNFPSHYERRDLNGVLQS